MEFIISGQAGVFASLKPAALYSLDGEAPVALKGHNLGLAFHGCSDTKRIAVHSVDQARRECELSWAKDRSLRCILLFLDPTEEPSDRLEFAECAEELIRDFSTRAFLLDQLSCSPLPDLTDFTLVANIKTSCPETWSILDEVLANQPIIRTVSEALQNKLKEFLDDPKQRAAMFDALTDVGAQRSLVEAKRANSPQTDMIVLRLIAQFRHIEGSRGLIEAWTAGMRSTKRLSPTTIDESEDEEPDNRVFGSTALGGRKAFEQAMKQQAAIVAKLRSRDLEGARRFVDDLVAAQKLNSSPEHVGKSLSRLSHEAKELGVPELQIEWAELAVKANPSDPVTFAHLADALISAFRFNEALAAIDSMKSLGASLSAENARARILRMTGRPCGS
ncbi:hypothetical protein BRDID11002_08810 [Bradyrhizobium diazoefficiens]